MAAEETKQPQTQTQQQPAAENKPAAQEKPKAEKQTNCLACNKPLKKIKLYYRDGKYYCSKKCWRDYKEKQKQEKGQAKEEKKK